MSFIIIFGLIFICGSINALDSQINITEGIVEKNPNAIPSPKNEFDSGKQILEAVPRAINETVPTTINAICSAINSVNGIKLQITPDIKNMTLLLMTPCKNYSVPLLKADEIWNNPAFNKTKNVIILITGWPTDGEETDIIYNIAKAYFCRGDVNLIILDAASYIDSLYTWTALNTDEIGLHLAKGLVELSKIVTPENIHLIGHSLGAHIGGSAGLNFYYETHKLLGRITGLDPSKTWFKKGENLSGLQRGDAEFIDIIHSNCGVFGNRGQIGDIDFYPGGLDPLKPGCNTSFCSHGRAWEYYAETVYPGNENNFLGIRCNSLTALHTNKCHGKGIPMGYGVPKDVKGNYFLDVNDKSPYGKNGKEEIVEQKKCGLCVK